MLAAAPSVENEIGSDVEYRIAGTRDERCAAFELVYRKYVEAELIKRIGEPGKKLHTGRSRNDQVAFDLGLWIHESADQLRSQLILLEKAFISLAERSKEVVMPSFTHLQRAQPISGGAEALAWASMFEDDFHLTTSLVELALRFSPLGSFLMAGT